MKNECTNIYVIYKFENHDEVNERLNYIKGSNKNIVFYNFERNSKKLWKNKAKKKIEKATFVLFFYDENVINDISKTKNIKWELEKARDAKRKIITICTKDKDELNQILEHIKNNKIEEYYSKHCNKDDYNVPVIQELFGTDYSGSEYDSSNFKPLNLEQGKEKVIEYSEWSTSNLLNNELLDDGNVELKKLYYDLLIKEYELMIQTSENLIERRDKMSERYRAVSITLISLVTASIAFGNLLLFGAATLVVGLLLIVISHSWLSSLDDYSRNNEGKYAVINEIERKLPANMFDTEYIYNKYKGIKTYSIREKSFPKVFKIVGIFLIVLGIIFAVLAIIAYIKNGNFDLKNFFETIFSNKK